MERNSGRRSSATLRIESYQVSFHGYFITDYGITQHTHAYLMFMRLHVDIRPRKHHFAACLRRVFRTKNILCYLLAPGTSKCVHTGLHFIL